MHHTERDQNGQHRNYRALFDKPAFRFTMVGVFLSSVLPIPSWPLKLFPQHMTLPLSIEAQVCLLPAARDTAKSGAKKAVFTALQRSQKNTSC